MIYLTVSLFCGRADKLCRLFDCITVAEVVILSSRVKPTEIIRSVILGVLLIVIITKLNKQSELVKYSP